MKQFHPQNGLFPGFEVLRDAAQPLQYLLSWISISGVLAKLLVGSRGSLWQAWNISFAKSCWRFVLVKGTGSNEDQTTVFTGGLGREVLGTCPQKMPETHRTQFTCYPGLRDQASKVQNTFRAAQLTNGLWFNHCAYKGLGPKWH